ncbi:MAG: SNF2-related protein, partial [Thermoguttaceae bacterium]
MKTKSRRKKTKQSKKLTLKDRLSRLTYVQACQLLGPEGADLIRKGATYQEIDLDRDVYLRGDLFRLTLPGAVRGKDAVATITTMAEARNRLRFNCTACETMCEHVGAAVSLILEEKTALGLAAVPDEKRPLETLSEQELVEQALSDRRERAATEKFRFQSSDPRRPWTDYTITSALSGKSYRVALRGEERGQSFCSCPDFRTNTLGTCKHIMHLAHRVRRRFPASVRGRPYRNREAFVHVLYGEEVTLHLQLPDQPAPELVKAAGPLAGGPIDDVRRLVECLKRMERLGRPATVYPDAEELIQRRLFQHRMSERMAEIQKDPARHPLRKQLLKVELLPYQLEGIAFAVGAGRAILADDMGLGKTIQGVGAAEVLAREADIRKVLVVCPASVKSQWRSEIRRFSDRSVQLVIGGAAQRAPQYQNDCFFTVCNYEQVLRDIMAIERVHWDLIILDEGQRIKNWEAKT